MINHRQNALDKIRLIQLLSIMLMIFTIIFQFYCMIAKNHAGVAFAIFVLIMNCAIIMLSDKGNYENL